MGGEIDLGARTLVTVDHNYQLGPTEPSLTTKQRGSIGIIGFFISYSQRIYTLCTNIFCHRLPWTPTSDTTMIDVVIAVEHASDTCGSGLLVEKLSWEACEA